MRRITIEVADQVITEIMNSLRQRQRAFGEVSLTGRVCEEALRAIKASLEQKESVVANPIPGSHVRSSEL